MEIIAILLILFIVGAVGLVMVAGKGKRKSDPSVESRPAGRD